MPKFTFAVGVWQTRHVTVFAASYETSVMNARRELDNRAHRSGREAPVAWDLTLTHVDGKPCTKTEYLARVEDQQCP
jgi:hypothetical protein